MKPHRYNTTKDDWTKKKQLFNSLFQCACKEFCAKSQQLIIKPAELEKNYEAIHNDLHSKKGLKEVFYYLSWRIEAKFTFTNMFNLMQWRHEVYKRLYEVELKLHQGNEIDALRCVRKNLGTSKQAFELIDLKDEPTILTKISVFLNTLLKLIFRKKLTMPLLKLSAFMFDVTKDIGFATYMAKLLFGKESEESSSTEDYYVFTIYVISLILGQTLLSLFSLTHRYSSFSICPHHGSQLGKTIFFVLVVVFFPVTGIAMSSDKYFNHRYAEKDMKKIVDGLPNTKHAKSNVTCLWARKCKEYIRSRFIKPTKRIDWSDDMLRKSEFEDLMTRFKFIDAQERVGGFQKIKMVEGCIESYLQILVVLFIFFQKPYEGVFNQSMFGLSLKEEESFLGIQIQNGPKLIFILSSLMGYAFLATGVVAFIDVLQKNSIGVKEKILLILIYLLKIGVSMLTSLLLLMVKSSVHDSLGFLIWLSIISVKLLCLFSFLLFKHEKEDSKFDLILSLACNLNMPVHLKPFEETDSSTNGLPKLDDRLIVTWGLSAMELMTRSICIFMFSGAEMYYKTFPYLNGASLVICVLLLEILVIVMWHTLLKKLFIWRQLMDSNSGVCKGPTYNQTEKEVDPEGGHDEETVVNANGQSLE